MRKTGRRKGRLGHPARRQHDARSWATPPARRAHLRARRASVACRAACGSARASLHTCTASSGHTPSSFPLHLRTPWRRRQRTGTTPDRRLPGVSRGGRLALHLWAHLPPALDSWGVRGLHKGVWRSVSPTNGSAGQSRWHRPRITSKCWTPTAGALPARAVKDAGAAAMAFPVCVVGGLQSHATDTSSWVPARIWWARCSM